MSLVGYGDGVKPVGKQMTKATMRAIEALRICRVEPVHPARKIRLRSLDQEMEMVGQQAVGLAQPAMASDDSLEKRQEMKSVMPRHEDRGAIHTLGGHVVNASRLEDARRARHSNDNADLDGPGRPMAHVRIAFGTRS